MNTLETKKETLLHYHTIGSSYLHQGDYSRASKYFRKGLHLLKEAHSTDRMDFMERMGNVYLLKGEYRKTVDTCKAGMDHVDHYSNQREIAALCRTLGAACSRLNDYASAEKYFSIALKIFGDYGDRNGEALTLFNQAMLDQSRARYSEALKTYNQCLKLFKRNKDEVNLISTIMNLGTLYHEMNDYATALKHYQACLLSARKIQNLPLIAKVSNNLGNLFLSMGSYRESEELILYSLRLCRDLKIPYLIGYNHLLLGILKLKTGEGAESIENSSKALHSFQEADSQREVCLAEIHLANAYCESRSRRLAEQHLSEAFRLSKEIGSKELAMHAVVVKAKLERIGGNGKCVLGMLEKAKDYFEASQRWELLWEIFYEIGRIYEEAGDVGKVQASWRHSANFIEKILSKIPEERRGEYLKDRDRQSVYQNLYSEKGSPYSPLEAPDGFDTMVGGSKAVLEILDAIDRVANSSIPVSIQGETGTGKELVARLVHGRGNRRDKPFTVIDCASLSENLVESELFGHEKGAFTGACERRIGKLESVRGGTLFLDEVENISPYVQGKLLRFLQEKEFTRVGGNEIVRVDARIISASKKDLAKEVETGMFREDLFYRLRVYLITLPPLRERREDIPLLIEHFLAQVSKNNQRKITLEPQAMDLLYHYDFPGNVRQLKNEILHACILADSKNVLGREMFSEKITRAKEGATEIQNRNGSFLQKMENMERDIVIDALMMRSGNISRAAEDLGLSRYGLYKKMKRLKIQNFKSDVPKSLQECQL
ncbi:MAG: sigma 54-interacting transcriptional regulator [Deltaproteobacteria bacterium]|nr:sigma 54-interacting transcriptional regulator [Deltaproteobacteria bacterium]